MRCFESGLEASRATITINSSEIVAGLFILIRVSSDSGSGAERVVLLDIGIQGK